jgi:hypothetical protein
VIRSLTFDHLVEIRKQRALEEAQDPEPEERTERLVEVN